jgi:hypothetical protein
MRKVLAFGLLFVVAAIVFPGCATTGDPASPTMSPTITGYISTGASKRF